MSIPLPQCRSAAELEQYLKRFRDLELPTYVNEQTVQNPVTLNSTDDLPEGDVNKYMTAAQEAELEALLLAIPITPSATSSFVQNSGSAVNHNSTFDGYTIMQIVKALRTAGILA